MAYYKTEGIVLRRTNLGEADRIVTFLTPDRGKLKAVAKGVRRIKSRMAGHLELFSRVNLQLVEGKNLDVITSAQLVTGGDGLAADYAKVSYGYLFAEMIDRLLDEGVESTNLYRDMAQLLERLDSSGPDGLLELTFKLRLLDTLGYRPHLEGCTICRRDGQADVTYYFSSAMGGIVDAGCATERTHPLSHNQIKLWRLALSHPIEQVAQLSGAVAAADGTLVILNDFYDYTFGKRFLAQEMAHGR